MGIGINGANILALEESLDYQIKMIQRPGAMFAGGMFNMRISGKGWIAYTTQGPARHFTLTGAEALFTDPHATVAWSDGLDPGFVLRYSLKTILGRGSGESLQLQFRGTGEVIIQASERVFGGVIPR